VAVTVVFFDVGETLVDETRAWAHAAADLGVTAPTLLGAIGATIARGQDHRAAYDVVGRGAPSWDGYRHEVADLYPDALPCLGRVRDAGYALGVAANQHASLDELFGGLVDHVLSSATLGLEKPDPRFFEAMVATAGRPPAEIAYVGDRVDNDVDPAVDAGLVAVHIRRGPWGHVQEGRARAHVRIDSLDELPEALRGH
jgi:FMN phosphatase YigB (HAD superfamily)